MNLKSNNLEDRLNNNNGLDTVRLTDTLIFKVEDSNSEIKSLEADIQRVSNLLELAETDPQRYAKVIDKYRKRIEESTLRIYELKEQSVSADGGPQRPRQDFGDPKGAYSIAEAVKEKEALRNYFTSKNLSSVLKTEEDWAYASMGVRLLNSMGKLLDNYEIGLPANYKLELLRRVGRQVKIFEGRDVDWYQPPEKMENGFVFRTDFMEDPKRHVKHRPGLSSYENPLKNGFLREGKEYLPLWQFVFLRDTSTFPYIGASKDKAISEKVFPWKTRTSYLYVINPRGLNAIDIENSPEAQYESYIQAQEKGEIPPDWKTKLHEPEKITKRQKEVTFIDKIDPRDIKGCFLVEWVRQGNKFIPKTTEKFIPNPNYLPSHWELPGVYKL